MSEMEEGESTDVKQNLLAREKPLPDTEPEVSNNNASKYQSPGTLEHRPEDLLLEVKSEVLSDDEQGNEVRDDSDEVHDRYIRLVHSKNVVEHAASDLAHKEHETCSLCSTELPQSFTVKKARKKQVPGEKKFACNICCKEFARRNNLLQHLMVHTREKNYICSVCDKEFTQISNLKRHLLVHSGDKPFVCDICKQGFSQKETLKRHEVVHTGERPYICGICNVGFTQSGILKRHQLVHTGEKSFFCSLCSKQFSSNNSLKRHQLVHTGEKPFICYVCKQGFSQNETLKRHLLIH
ncbi:gastrula zinc finger protein XlCGF7.1-like [Physella acuta]|uniref:gastrula zinc finger protein XlCGF7.1-like n=1 Tax=Physella acuta TaxID=109671 RepID=UPI0027DB93F6|nr:gastrula zinc finger protein XlCGF7.1-like [Physella acuta]